MVIYASRMFGISLVMMRVMTAGLNQLPLHLHSHGTAEANTFQQMAASIGTALLMTVMYNAVQDYIKGHIQLYAEWFSHRISQ